VDAFLPLLKEFGFPIALCVALMWALRHQNAQLVKAYTDRIGTLERIVKTLTEKVDELERDRIRRADEYGHTLKAIAVSWSASTRETNDLTRSSLAVLRKLCDAVGACQGYHPHPSPRPPTSGEVPADPSKVPTDRLADHA
jgi:hypothetical protein